MTKRALLVAVNHYPPPAVALEAPINERMNWSELLSDECGFAGNITEVPETEAMRKRVLYELRKIFKSAAAGDQILVGFYGHGALTRGWESDDEPSDDVEHAFIVYPGESSPPDFQSASITPSDFVRILTETAPPPDVQIALLLDICFAEGFGRKRYHGESPFAPQVQFIPDAVPDLPEGIDARSFDSIDAALTTAIAHPIILAAAHVDEPAHEVGFPNYRRLLFSSCAIDRLYDAYDDEKRSLTHQELIDGINPLSDEQEAVITGNTDLAGALFVGGFPRYEGGPPRLRRSLFGGGATEVTAPRGTLRIRLFGLVTIIDLPRDGRPYRTRFVMPYDTQASSPAKMHRAFVEVADHDMVTTPSGVPPTPPGYYRGGVKYSRWPLTAHQVIVANLADNGSPVQFPGDWKYHVPSLVTVGGDGMDPLPRDECRKRIYPPPELFTGFFDVETGTLVLGDLEAKKTEYKGIYSPPNEPPRFTANTPTYVDLTVPLKDDYAVVGISDAHAKSSVIYVASGTTITIGNAREEDINGPGSGENPRESFLVYYNLSAHWPYNPGVPDTKQIPLNACTVTGYP